METNTGTELSAEDIKHVPDKTVEDESVSELVREARDGRQLVSILARHVGERGYEDATPEGVLNRIISERDELAKAYAVITGDIMQTTQEELDAARATIARLQPKT